MTELTYFFLLGTNFSDMELTFRQATYQTGQVEFPDANHCTTTENGFGFVTKDFCKNNSSSF